MKGDPTNQEGHWSAPGTGWHSGPMVVADTEAVP